MEISEIFGWAGSLLDMFGLRQFVVALAIVSVALTLLSRLMNR